VPEEPALERDQQLALAERLDLLRLALLGRHVEVGVDRRVGSLERIAHLVALEHVVVGAHEAVGALGEVDRSADGPDRPRLALDPDGDDLGRAVVAHAPDRALGEPLRATAVVLHRRVSNRRGRHTV
jgi:hypothetical protein